MAFKRNTDSGQLWLSLNEKFPKLSAINKLILFPAAFESEFYQWLQQTIQKYVENDSLHKIRTRCYCPHKCIHLIKIMQVYCAILNVCYIQQYLNLLYSFNFYIKFVVFSKRCPLYFFYHSLYCLIPGIISEEGRSKKVITEFAENSLVSIFPIIHSNWDLKAEYFIQNSSKKCFNYEYTILLLSLSNSPPRSLCQHI